jgi:NADH:ubiquinone reductase (H+-translocating)
MRHRRRWGIAGIGAGGLAGVVALATYWGQSNADVNNVAPGIILYLASTMLVGIGYGWLIKREPQRLQLYESLPAGMISGFMAWVLFGLILTPVLAGIGVQWQAAQAAALLPLLVIYLLQSVVMVLLLHLMQLAGWLVAGDSFQPTDSVQTLAPHRVVILGGGFAGVTTAQELEKLCGDNHHIEITLVSQTNHLLFTPMLAEVTAGGVEAQHINPPLRAFFGPRVRVIQGEPSAIDPTKNSIMVRSGRGVVNSLNYDQLVLALGAVPNFFGNVDVERFAFTFKTLSDAIRIRNHVLNILEQADGEADPHRRRAMLTFVVVGAGFAGSELIGGLNDFIRGSLWYYKNLRNEEITLLLVHPGQHILPELSAELAAYAEEKMTARGVTILTGRVTGAGPGNVSIGSETFAADTLIWTAGNIPNPILRIFECETNKRGAVITDATLLVRGQHNLWAVGDCAAIPDVVTGAYVPPTAQHALQAAKTLAYNLHAALLLHRELKPFHYHSRGILAVVGHQTACAEVFGLKFSGLFAWLMWRSIYLSKLPTLEKKVRVLLDWVIDIFFPRDIAYTPITDDAPMVENRTEPETAMGD